MEHGPNTETLTENLELLKIRGGKGLEGKLRRRISNGHQILTLKAGVSGRWNIPECWNVAGIWQTLEENNPSGIRIQEREWQFFIRERRS